MLRITFSSSSSCIIISSDSTASSRPSATLSVNLEDSFERPRIESYNPSELNITNISSFPDESCLDSRELHDQSNISQNELDELNKLIFNCEIQLSLAVSPYQ